MARVNSTVTRTSVRIGMNTGPDGPVWRWRETAMQLAEFNAFVTAPVNNPKNAVHRGGRVGVYKVSFGTNRIGSNGSHVKFTLYNTARHAKYVEYGNTATRKWMYFSWSKGTATRPAGVPAWRKGRSGRKGQHIIERAAKAAVNSTTGGPL